MRFIVHSDINHCYAQIEEMMHPDLKAVPMAVGGHEELRHGIILAKNDLAKASGVKTAMSLREARQVCPDLLIIPPHYDDYIYYTTKVKDIYRQYTDAVESFGLDEAWIDLTHSQALFGDPVMIAQTIQKRVYEECGINVSMGVSYNKIFAKMGSDLHKKRGFDVIMPDNYQKIIWPLPIEDLFYVGVRTAPKLRARGIGTVGDLATMPKGIIKSFLGKMGEYLWYFANGYDESEVQPLYEGMKSVGNGITTCKDMNGLNDLKIVLTILCESVATRLKQAGLKGAVVRIGLRGSNLRYFSRQRKLERATNVSYEILDMAMTLVKENIRDGIFRSVHVTVSSLKKDDGVEQLSLFDDLEKHDCHKQLDQTIDAIRERFGYHAIGKAIVLEDQKLADFNPLEENVIHPVGYLK